jgi:hypothetical protein
VEYDPLIITIHSSCLDYQCPQCLLQLSLLTSFLQVSFPTAPPPTLSTHNVATSPVIIFHCNAIYKSMYSFAIEYFSLILVFYNSSSTSSLHYLFSSTHILFIRYNAHKGSCICVLQFCCQIVWNFPTYSQIW